jgi:hypothetical protein
MDVFFYVDDSICSLNRLGTALQRKKGGWQKARKGNEVYCPPEILF